MAKIFKLTEDEVKVLLDFIPPEDWPACKQRLREVSAPKTPGAHTKWTQSRIMHVWIAIKAEMYKHKLTSVDAAAKRWIPNRKPWYAWVGELVREPNEFEIAIKTVRRARELHTEGEKLMQQWKMGNRRRYRYWMHSLEVAKQCIDEGWGVIITSRANNPAGHARNAL